MAKISKVIKEYPFLLITVLVSIISVSFFIFLPFQVTLFPETVVKKLYYVDNISDAHLRIIKKFNEANKNKIEVVPVNLPFYNFTTNDRKVILTRSLRSWSDGIDIFAVDLIWIPRFAKWGYTLNQSFDAKTLSKVNPMALRACYEADSLVAFPLFLDMGVLYYRKDLIDKLSDAKEIKSRIQRSLTWDEFIQLGHRFRGTGNPFYLFTGGNFEGMMCCFHELLSNEESDKIFYQNPIDLQVNSVKKALQFLRNLIHTYKYSPFDVTRFDEYTSYLHAYEKNALFMRGWVGYHKQYKRFLRDTSNIANTEIAPLPHFKGNSTSSVFGGWSLMISKNSKRKEEALKFISFMFRKENQQILYDEGGYLPINTEVFEDSTYIKANKELMQIQKLLKWGKLRPSLENYTRLSEIMARSFHRALKNEISVDKALEIASTEIRNEKPFLK